MIRFRRGWLFLGLISFLFGGCDRPKQITFPRQQAASKPLTAAPEVTSEAEEGFHDLVFFIAEQKTEADGAQVFRASGTHKGRQLGFEVVLGPTWKGGSPPDKNIPIVLHSGMLNYRSTGPESDAFVAVLDELYRSKISPTGMRTNAMFTAISLEGDPANLKAGAARIKCFHETDKQEEYAEFFTNLDVNARRLEVREKDEEYRKAVVRALAVK